MDCELDFWTRFWSVLVMPVKNETMNGQEIGITVATLAGLSHRSAHTVSSQLVGKDS